MTAASDRFRRQCADYVPKAPGDALCLSYLPSGACSRPERLMCVVWLERNRPEAASANPAPAPDSASASSPPEPPHAAANAPGRGRRPVLAPDTPAGTLPEGQVYRNETVSFSRLDALESCPLKFWFRYVAGAETPPTRANETLLFGTAAHRAIEVYTRGLLERRYAGHTDAGELLAALHDALAVAPLTAAEWFEDARLVAERYVEVAPEFDHRRVLGIELPFEVRVPGCPAPVTGFIDLVEEVDADTVRVVDYKTNRLVHGSDEVRESLQLSLYDRVVAERFPRYRKRELVFHLLRHGVRLTTSRTPEESARAMDRLAVLARQSEALRVFPGKVSGNCVYCDFRDRCPEFAAATAGSGLQPAQVDPNNPEALVREWKRVSAVAKDLYRRKEQLGELLAGLLWGEGVVVDGRRYAVGYKRTRKVADEKRLLCDLFNAVQGAPFDLAARVARVSVTAVDDLLRDLRRRVKAGDLRPEFLASLEEKVAASLATESTAEVRETKISAGGSHA